MNAPHWLPTLAVSTCDRQPQYVHDMLLSLYSKDLAAGSVPNRLVVCGPDTRFLGDISSVTPFAPRSPVVAETLDAEQWAFMQKQDMKRRVARNFMRLLAGCDMSRRLLALQDDIAFTSGWFGKMLLLVQQLEADVGNNFILSLYASARFKDGPLAPYDPHRFFGNQALYFTPTARDGLMAYMAIAEREGKLAPDDMMVKGYVLASASTKLFAANPSLVQHVGECSAIEDRFHRSPTFRDAP